MYNDTYTRILVPNNFFFFIQPQTNVTSLRKKKGLRRRPVILFLCISVNEVRVNGKFLSRSEQSWRETANLHHLPLRFLFPHSIPLNFLNFPPRLSAPAPIFSDYVGYSIGIVPRNTIAGARGASPSPQVRFHGVESYNRRSNFHQIASPPSDPILALQWRRTLHSQR